MVLTGTALLGGTLLGGTLALGVATQRGRRTKPTLATLLRAFPPKEQATPQRKRLSLSRRAVALGLLVTSGSTLLLAGANGYTPLVLARQLAAVLQHSRYGPLLYLFIDTLRPLTLFPDSIMSLTSGLIFGPVKGFVLSYIGFGTAAFIAYNMGRLLRGSPTLVSTLQSAEERNAAFPTQSAAVHHGLRPLLTRYGRKMQEHPFLAMVLMHGLFLEADAVNILAGYLGLPLRPFLSGAMLGIIAPLTATVLAGGSLHGSLTAGALHLNPAVLAASGVVLVSSVGVAWYLQRREINSMDNSMRSAQGEPEFLPV
ncbi:MAG: TVP38/TMEM64 family protein [Caldilineaceae bacterium]|nr:TVP38/TMEM64 family protein [Caldilineaceae bacterium]